MRHILFVAFFFLLVLPKINANEPNQTPAAQSLINASKEEYPEGYQNTKWGMSKEEVVQALPDLAFESYLASVKIDKSLGDELRAGIELAGMETSLSLYFKENMFWEADFRILIDLNKANELRSDYAKRKYSEVREALKAKWGMPDVEDLSYSGMISTIWSKKKSEAILTFFKNPNRVSQYEYELNLSYKSPQLEDEFKQKLDTASANAVTSTVNNL